MGAERTTAKDVRAIRCTTRMQCERGLNVKWRDKENSKKKRNKKKHLTESRHLSIDRTRPYRKTYKVRKMERKKR